MTPAPARSRVLLAFAVVYLIWGSTYLAIGYAVQTIPPFLMGSARFFAAGAILYAWLWLKGEAQADMSHWKTAGITGGFLLLGGNGGVSWAEQRVSTGAAALIVAATPLWMALLNWVRHKQTLDGKTLAGIVAGFAGMAILIAPGKFAGSHAVDPLGAAVLLCASISWSFGTLYSKHAPATQSPFLGAALQMLCGGAWLLLAGFLHGEFGQLDWASVSAQSLWSVAYLVLFGSLAGFTAYIWLSKNVSLSKLSTYAYVNPVVAVFLGWLFAGEPVTFRKLAAMGIILGSVVIITARPIKA